MIDVVRHSWVGSFEGAAAKLFSIKLLSIKFLGSLLFMLFALAPVASVAATAIEGGRVWVSPEKTRLVLDFTDKPTYKIFTLKSPHRIVLDFEDSKLKMQLRTLVVSNSLIKKVRYGKRGARGLRLVLDMYAASEVRHFILRPTRQHSYRLVVDLVHRGGAVATRPSKNASSRIIKVAPPKQKNEAPKTLPTDKLKKQSAGSSAKPVKRLPANRSSNPVIPKVVQPSRSATSAKTRVRKKNTHYRDLMVVIDPGHGGNDPGALGQGGTQEKTLVLQIARLLNKRLNQERGIKSVLTRDNDSYVKLEKRRDMAREKYRADLFVSIHADAWKNHQAKGASVYVVSQKGASSALAGFLADTANESDRIAGFEVNTKDKFLKNVLADLTLLSNIDQSFKAANIILSKMKRVTPVHKDKVEKAGFLVLKSVDIPSVLIETGFISNPKEEQKLKSHRHQTRLVKAIGDGIIEYFRLDPPRHSLFSQWYGSKPLEHRVRPGETLSDIAQRYRVRVRSVKELNVIKSDKIRAGQRLLIPKI